jgi:hypothetical protein
MRSARWSVMLLVFGAAACGDRSIAAPEAFGRIPCRPSPALVAMVTIDPFPPSAMRSALIHGADVMTLAITDGARHTRDVQDAMRAAATDIDQRKFDSACRLVEIAYAALTVLPDSDASRPDRVGIGLILALTAQALTTVIGP